MRQIHSTLSVQTNGRGFYEITREIRSWIAQNQCLSGLLTVQILHTSASLLIQENADPDVRRDLETFMSDLVQDGDKRFVHRLEGPDDMSAHIRTALTSVNLSIPVRDGRLVLGTWQGIYVWEHRTEPNTRDVALHYIGE
jgi:secondary thiamine-phosphate synthase enzyme